MTLRMLLGGLIFAQTIRWAWAWWRARRPMQRSARAHRFMPAGVLARLLEATGAHPYAALPWDPSAQLRVAPLTRAETRAAWQLERLLAATDERAG